MAGCLDHPKRCRNGDLDAICGPEAPKKRLWLHRNLCTCNLFYFFQLRWSYRKMSRFAHFERCIYFILMGILAIELVKSKDA